jgi:hypothetical protein
MGKIATPSDLITQLTSLQERVSSEPVSRDVVASELRALADKISASGEVTYKEEEKKGVKYTTFYRGKTQIGNPSSSIKHPELIVKVIASCASLTSYEISILKDLI